MIQFVFTEFSKKRFGRLQTKVQERLLQKLKSLKSHQDIFSVLKSLHHFEPASHRLRVGEYRLILELKAQNQDTLVFWVLDVGHRRDVYR